MKKAFSYIRMSTESQLLGDSRRRQLEKSKEYAEHNGYEFIDSIEDIGVSAFNSKNIKEGELGRFIKAVKDGEIDSDNTVLLVESFDRFSRDNILTAFNELTKFLETGITIITIADGQKYTKRSIGKDIGQLYTVIGVLIRANEESQIKSDRLLSAWKSKRNNLSIRKLTSIAPAWLELDKETNTFEEKEHAVATVHKIFELCIDEGLGMYSITRHLNHNLDNYPKFTKAKIKNRLKNGRDRTGWHKSYISKILHNKATYGEFQPHKMENGRQVPDGNPISNYFPAIISKERFILAQSRLRGRALAGGGRKGDTFNNIFTKVLKCGNCGSSLIYKDKGKPPKGGIYLRCHNADVGFECSAPYWRYSDFENDFFQFINELPIKDILQGDTSKKRLVSLHQKHEILQEKVKIHEEEYSQFRKRMKSLPEDLLPDFINDATKAKEQLDKLKLEEEKVRNQIADLETVSVKKTHDALVANIKTKLQSTSKTDSKMLRQRIHNQIRNIISHISIHNSVKEIFPWEKELCSKELLTSLEHSGIKSDDEIEQFLNSVRGKKAYNESERYFTVHFKNGTVKEVHPFKEFAYYSTDKRMAQFLNKI